MRSPRTFKPKDVLSACQNNELILKSGDPPAAVVSLATYLMTDFFAMSHATGLYNRQKQMWESLSKVNAIHVTQLDSGIFKKVAVEVFDFAFVDYKGKPLIAALLVTGVPEKQSPLSLLKAFIGRVQGKSSLNGALACFPVKFPEEVVDFLSKQTDSTDLIGKYESILPALKVPFDLLEMNVSNLLHVTQENNESAELRTVFHLVHPDLKKGRADQPAPRAWTRKKRAKPEAEQQDSLEGSTEEKSSALSDSDVSDTV